MQRRTLKWLQAAILPRKAFRARTQIIEPKKIGFIRKFMRLPRNGFPRQWQVAPDKKNLIKPFAMRNLRINRRPIFPRGNAAIPAVLNIDCAASLG
jgi:hypothetical protein